MLSIVTQLRNESQRIPEWIKYHAKIGIDNFIIFDDYSDDQSIEILNQLSNNYNIKTFQTVRSGRYIQSKDPNIYGISDLHYRIKISYNDGFNYVKDNFTHENHWCFFIEVDEFLDPKVKIYDYLKTIPENIHRLHIPSYDFEDNIDLNKNVLPQSKYRWSDETKNNSIFFARCKSAYKVFDRKPNILCIHHLDYSPCIKTFGKEITDKNGNLPSVPECQCIIRNDEDALKINHYRIPANLNKFDIFDDALSLFNL